MMTIPALSYIVLTDQGTTIAPLLAHLRKQSIAEQLELVVVAPCSDAVTALLEEATEIGRVVIVDSELSNYASAQAKGIHAATAPYAFIGETHSFPHACFAETLVATFTAGPWSVVAPGISNANPINSWSWSAYLCDYAIWSPSQPASECREAPIYNAAYKLSHLKAFGSDLEHILERGNALPLALRARGARTRFEPAARLDHVNIASRSHWVSERILTGHLVAAHRLSHWRVSRRLLYLLASPLIAFEMFRRVLPGSWRTIRQQHLSPILMAFILAGMVFRTWGEFLGYLGVPATQAERRMLHYEIHKLEYATAATSPRF